MRRVLIYDRFDAQVCELSENDVFELTRHEVVNGAHELTITTTQVLEKGYRVLMEDDRGYWHEWCVSGIDELHANGSRPYGSYYCVWSLQPDLMGTRVSAMPGVQTPTTAALALDAALGGTSRWTRGTITNTNTGGASMYDTDGWSAMSTLVANWGGEVDTTIGVSSSGVVSRQVDLYAQQGESTAKRRFDFGADLVSVRRTIADDPLYCRITPRGKGEATEGGGYGRKITIESVNDGKDYLENAAMVDLAKLPDGNGGWEYPTLEVENSNCETPADLLTWAQGVLDAYTTPKIMYEVNVVQAAKEGIDLQGVSLGDAVQVVDGKFNDLRLTGRVMEMTTDELAHTTTQLTIGNVGEGISERFSDLYSGIKTAEQSVTQLAQSLSTADYIDDLLDRINTEINATGGYAYIVPGNGILTFDVAVADPLNPVEASRVVEIKGGTIRIANSKTAQGQWEWKTVFTSGHVAAELVTAAELVAGYIGSATSGTYWDLDNNLLNMGATTILDGNNLADSIEAAGLANTMVRAYGSGVLVCKQGNTVGALVNSNGSFDIVAVTWSGTTPTASTVYSTYGTTSTIGTPGSTRVEVSSDAITAYYVSGVNEIQQLFLGGSLRQYTVGSRKAGSTVGSSSVSIGTGNTSSGSSSIAIGNTVTSSGYASAAIGNNVTASGSNSFATGVGTLASGSYQTALGKWNATNTSHYLIVGNGNNSSSRANAMYVASNGNMWIAGTLTQNSDRRLKQHVAYLGDDANVIINRLKPAVFIKDGGRHYGFYAQDVQRADIWDTKTVEAQHTDESLDFDPLTLDYSALIAPLTAYVQNLEKRIEELERRLDDAE
ncbi:MAG: phage tail protein [Prevotella sp.]|nr:phage tail protein [Prevotella sp.]